ncbi:hypothetical protein F5Y17DRAFT_42773 [Xylariaceae sp. FL0594]|nr:hypothetical protein F5Y17DRAFT_42773 [Xylariaceae sp. FL0594]
MSEFQQWRKRGWEDEEDIGSGPQGFTEHRNKRLQALPVRTSPTAKLWAEPLNFSSSTSTITPTNTDCDSDDAQLREPDVTSMDVDQDSAMDVEVAQPPPEFIPPGNSQPDVMMGTSVTGRVPTPIHCTFAAQVRGSNWASVPPVVESSNGAVQHAWSNNSVPRSLEGTTEWPMARNRRLPSPISENGGEEVPGVAGMVLGNCSPVMAQLQRPYLPHMPHSTNPHAMIPIHPNIRMSPQPVDADASMMEAEAGSPSSAPATPSPRGKYGHSRSKHTLNNWTLQPGMKKSFSIGYRADCEKCRMKIPGHFNHIIIS